LVKGRGMKRGRKRSLESTLGSRKDEVKKTGIGKKGSIRGSPEGKKKKKKRKNLALIRNQKNKGQGRSGDQTG